MPLSAEDRLAIHELYARYTHTFDARDAEGWANVFAPDGGFRYLTQRAESQHGREALREWAGEWYRDGDPAGAEIEGSYFHFTSNVAVSATDDGARGVAYVVALVAGPNGIRFNCFGRYDDDLVLTEDGWRFGERRFRQLSPESLRGQFLELCPAEQRRVKPNEPGGER